MSAAAPLSTTSATVFLVDVDNTLIDTDAFSADLDARLRQDFGDQGRAHYWALLAAQRERDGVVDYLAALQAFREGREHEPALQQFGQFLLEYPWAQRLYPQSLEVLMHLGRLGLPVLLSEGDVVLQPRKIQRSGLWDAVSGRAMVVRSKVASLPTVHHRYPAERYVLVDDKPSLISALRPLPGTALSRIFVRQGHYALDPATPAPRPPPELCIDDIGELLKLDFAGLRFRRGAG